MFTETDKATRISRKKYIVNMNISNFSFERFDAALDHIPVCSTLSNLTALFVKAAILPCKDPDSISAGSYYAVVEEKSTFRCAVLLVPVIGQIIVMRNEKREQIRAFLREDLAQWLDDSTARGNKELAAQRILEAFDCNHKSLDLSSLGLSSIPSAIGSLKCLKKLFLDNNSLSTLPDELWNLTNLEELDLGRNRISFLPPSIGDLKNLEVLYLHENILTSLPPEIGDLTFLVRFSIAQNQLSSLPSSFSNLTDLRELSLAFNQLRDLPEEFGNLPDLKELDLGGNQLEEVPLSVTHLVKLKALSLAFNQLSEIPSSICNLESLKRLYLPGNRLTTLPAELQNLTKLLELDLSHNQLSEFSIPLNERTEVTLYGNPLNPNPLDRWQERAGTSYLFQSFDALSENEQFTVKEWLRRLEMTSDFSGLNGQDLAKIVMDILNTALNPPANSDFPLFFFNQVQSNNESCQDRAAMALNELFTFWKIKTLPGNSSLKEAAPLIAASLKAHALRIVIANALTSESRRESAETYLYYELSVGELYKRRENLHLIAPLTLMRQMSYPDIGRREGMEERKLFLQVESCYLDFLLHFPLFETIIEQDEEFKNSWAIKDEAFFSQLETAENQDEVLKERQKARLEVMQKRLLKLLKTESRKITFSKTSSHFPYKAL